MTQAAQVADYASLTQYLVDTLDRANDAVFVAHTDVMIGLAEDTWTPTLLNRQMEASTTLTTDANGFVAYPADFYRPRGSNGAVNASNTYLPPIGPNAVSGIFPISTGNGVMFVQPTATGLQTQPPTASFAFTFDYWAKFVGLSASNTTNWIILNNPSLYQMSVLAQGALFDGDLQGAAGYKGIADGILGNITDYFALDYYMNAETVLDSVTP